MTTPAPLPSVVEAEGLTKVFAGKPALQGVDLTLPPGGITALVGSNGAGKTTLFRILLGLMHPTGGSSQVLGTDSRRLTPRERGRICFVNEEHSMPGWMRVGALADMERRLYPRWNEALFGQVLGNFEVDAGQRVSQLSRGERAGLNLALALAQSPTLLIMDEPTLGMDVVAKQAFLESLLFSPATEDRTILYCSHQMEEVERIADDLVVMEHGRVTSVSDPDSFRRRIRAWTVDFSGAPPDLSALPGVLSAREVDGQHHCLVRDQGEAFGALLRAAGALSVHSAPVSLTQALNGFLAQNHKTPHRERRAA